MIPEVVPQTVPLFAAELVETGECLAYLHLTGYHAALNSAKIEVGAVHLYETTLQARSQADFSVLPADLPKIVAT
jgi:hypothetical protein